MRKTQDGMPFLPVLIIRREAYGTKFLKQLLESMDIRT